MDVVVTSPRILVLSFYFEPDLSAGSFRTTSLVDALLRENPDVHVDVVTTRPNRYGSFASSAPSFEQRGRLRIHRIALPTHHSGMRDQSRAFFHYMQGTTQLVARERYSLVYATSSRLMTAALGARIARRLRAPLYLDIRDIFVETIADVLPGGIAPIFAPALDHLERWTVRAAAHVNLVSPGFADYFRARYPTQSFSFFTNGIDEDFIETTRAASDTPRVTDRPVRVLYAGNIGESQGLHAILPDLAQRMVGKAEFVVIGDGGRRAQLEKALADAAVTNVMLQPPVAREALLGAYQTADVLFLHLNDYDAFRKVLPSKVFEYAALGKPVWAGVAGFAAQFLATEVDNVAVFPPCDGEAALTVFNDLSLSDTPRPGFVEKYRRTRIMAEMADDILRVAGKA